MRPNVERGVGRVGSGLTDGERFGSLRVGIVWSGEIRWRVGGARPVRKNVEAFAEIRSGKRGGSAERGDWTGRNHGRSRSQNGSHARTSLILKRWSGWRARKEGRAGRDDLSCNGDWLRNRQRRRCSRRGRSRQRRSRRRCVHVRGVRGALRREWLRIRGSIGKVRRRSVGGL